LLAARAELLAMPMAKANVVFLNIIMYLH